MTEAAFLQSCDPAHHARPSVAIDLILIGVVAGRAEALLLRRTEHPHRDRWALPGGFVAIDEDIDAAAHRVLRDKAGMADTYLEQLYTFGAVDRDPRMRVIGVAYLALLSPDRIAAALAAEPRLTLAELVVPADDGAVAARSRNGDPLPLAFDHAAMLGLAMRRLRGKLDYSDVAFALVPERFTLRALQDVHEAIRGQRLNKPAFRRRMLDSGRLHATGERETGAAFRPAELFRAGPVTP